MKNILFILALALPLVAQQTPLPYDASQDPPDDGAHLTINPPCPANTLCDVGVEGHKAAIGPTGYGFNLVDFYGYRMLSIATPVIQQTRTCPEGQFCLRDPSDFTKIYDQETSWIFTFDGKDYTLTGEELKAAVRFWSSAGKAKAKFPIWHADNKDESPEP
jgi:hypothetical protein